ncbi:MAG: ABC transporter ATP-binding protein [Pirellulales bacterium]|nr:ABC transporter ATP-binding protein [Pirellulales bacterium]
MIGPSGSGKTTLLSILGGMLSPCGGQIMLHDTSVYDLSPADRAKLRQRSIGFVFQQFNLVPYLTALENAQLPLYLAGMARDEQRELATSLLQRVGLGDRLHHKPSELSVGQQQRVALARTVANQPAVILADEPTGNLDPHSRGCVLDFFDELHRDGRTLVMVTHDVAAAQRASRTITLADGAIVADSQAPRRNAA